MRLPSLPTVLALILAGLGAAIVLERANVRRHGYDLIASNRAADSAQHGADAAPPLTVARIASVDAEASDSIRRADTRSVIASRGTGTYVADILALSDSTLQRWPDRRSAPLRVYMSDVAPNGVDRVRSSYSQAVREAFTTWEGAELPIRFAFVADSALADITVSWVTDFRGEPVLGRTKVVRDSRFWIIRSDVQLATMRRDASGELDATVVRALAMHEIGHGIGLDHAADTTVIMAPKIRARALTLTDKATAQLLYSVPPGAITTLRRAHQTAARTAP
jgi:Matrixin